MSVRGPVPSPAASRQRVNKDTFSPLKAITSDGKKRGPNLPRDMDFCKRTKIWWDVWRCSPQAQLMTSTDWEAMLDAAMIHNEIYSPNPATNTPITSLTKELHRITANYGLTYVDRLKMRIRLDGEGDDGPREKGEPLEVPENVVSIYKNRLAA